MRINSEIKDRLQIVLVTYNRKSFLTRTLEQILAENSPVKDFDITILDNASSDGSSELIQKYCKKYDNITHIRHKVNIGGNANICRAFEIGVSSGKEYLWVLCDDDVYDFSNWNEVTDLVNEETDCICLSDYIFSSEKDKTDPAYQLVQLTFVPAGIYRTDLFTDNVMQNMYNSIFTLFQQLCPVCEIINGEGSIKVLSKPVVFNGMHFKHKTKEFSYTRGLKENETILQRSKDNSWPLGYANIISLLEDENLKSRTFEVAMHYKDVCGGMKEFYKLMNNFYIRTGKYNYFYEIYNVLPPNMKSLFKDVNDMSLFAYDLGKIKALENELEKKLGEINYLVKNPYVRYFDWIFSIKNSRNKKHKVLCVLGFKLKIKRKLTKRAKVKS